jgi:regulator of replication initiation timing
MKMTNNDAIKIITAVNEAAARIKYLERENDILRRENEFLRELVAKPKQTSCDIERIKRILSSHDD